MRTVPRVAPFDRPATYEDLERLPPQMVAEIVDGELHASPRPALRHAWTSSRLGDRIGPPFHDGTGGPGGWIILDEPELHFGADVLVPDLAGWRRTRMPRLPDGAFTTLAPDWVCEIVSPSTASLDRVKKLAIYAREGVSRLWLVDPLVRTIEILRLSRKRWTIVSTHAGDEVVRLEPFGEIELELRTLWGDDAGDSPSPPTQRGRRPSRGNP
jgi:Uma2 family endonuclease